MIPTTCEHLLCRLEPGGRCAELPELGELEDLDGLELELERAVLRDSFADFVEAAWPVACPGQRYRPNTASDAIVAHLQAVADGEIRRLAVALPPGLGKSTIVSVLWPAWRWARAPGWRVICASHAHDLALRDSRRTRRLVESDWYRARFPEVSLRDDANRVDMFETVADGRRQAVGVGGSLTGHRADCAVVDDSLNAVERSSKAARERVNTWFGEALASRLDGDYAQQVVIQQRLHSSDLIGYLQDTDPDGWEFLVLPAEHDERRACSTSVWTDPRTEPGELLAPGLLSAAKLAGLKRQLGTAGYSCQYQQSPVDEEGGVFRRGWWRFWKPDGVGARGARPPGTRDEDAVPLPRALERVVISVDAAFKDTATSDFVVALVVATRGAQRFVLEMRRGRMSYTATREVVRELAARYPGATVLIEDAANGTAVVDELNRQVGRVVAVRPSGGKESRAAAASPEVEAGSVFLPDGAGWLGDFVEEHAAFPRGRNDDIVDALSQALIYLTTPSDVARLIAAYGPENQVDPPADLERAERDEHERQAFMDEVAAGLGFGFGVPPWMRR